MAADDLARCQSDPTDCADSAAAGQQQIALGDIVRCDIAPYFFRTHADRNGALRLVPLEERSKPAIGNDDRAA